MNYSLLHRIYKYLNDKLSNRERHALEKEVNSDPFLQDAMDGFSKLSADELKDDLTNLQLRFGNTSTKKTIKLVPYLRIAASIILLLGIGSSIYYYTTNNPFKPKLAENQKIEKQENTRVLEITPEQISIDKDIEPKKLEETTALQEEPAQATIQNNQLELEKQTEDYSKEIVAEDEIKKVVEKPVSTIEFKTSDNALLSDIERKRYDDKFDKEVDSQATESLKGRVAGVKLESLDDVPDADKKLHVRGIASMSESSPIYVVDGKPVDNIANLSDADIESIDILKDASSQSIYGSQAANGVVLVTTKKNRKRENSNTINGKVLDAEGNPLPGANVVIAGTSKGVITDIDGNFSINADSAEKLKIAFIGYNDVELSKEELLKQNNEIKLEADLMALSEVVVVGYGTEKESITTGSISKLDASDISPGNRPEEFAPPQKKYIPKKIKVSYSTNANVKAEPIEGLNKYEKYFKKSFNYSSDSSLKIVVSFNVQTNGNLSEIEINESPNENYSNEVLRIINSGPKWKPSELNGEKVKERVTMTILFR